MTESEKKVLEGFLSKTLKIDTEDMAGLYNEAGELQNLTVASEADVARIKKIREESASQYKRGIKEGASKIEKELKDKYEIDSELEGSELVDFIVTQKVEEVKGAGVDDITKHPEYIKLQLETDKLLKAKDRDWQKKIDEREAEFNYKTVFGEVKDNALAELDNLKPILPEDARKAQRWREKFVEEIGRFQYQKSEDAIVVMREGKPVQDSHGYGVSFQDHVRSIAGDLFEFQAADERSAPGNKTNPTKPTGTIKSHAEYIDAMKKAKTPQERVQIMKSYVKK